MALAAGLGWQFVLVLVPRPPGAGDAPLAGAPRSTLAEAPRSPRTGRRSRLLWLVLIPAMALFAAEEFLPSLPAPVGRDFGAFASSQAGSQVLGGSWGWFAVLV